MLAFIILLVVWVTGIILDVGGNAIHLSFMAAIVLLIRTVADRPRTAEEQLASGELDSAHVTARVQCGNSAITRSIKVSKVIV